jgi:hypothetical protein
MCTALLAAADGAQPLRDIEVLVQVPAGNVVHRTGGRLVFAKADPGGGDADTVRWAGGQRRSV